MNAKQFFRFNRALPADGRQGGSESGQVPAPPAGWKQKLSWLGPGLTWMAAGAGGAGELLFPPRIGSLYGYTFVWALVAAIILKWAINREVGRFAVCSGGSLLDGFRQLPGPGHWAIWLIVLPQAVVALAAIAGLAGAAATALTLLLPGSNTLWMALVLVSTTAFLLRGRYALLERLATCLALGLALIGIVTALSVFPQKSVLLAGLRPALSPQTDYQEILPWLSFILAGSAGITWYSYWIPAKGYGAAALKQASGKLVIARQLPENEQIKLRGWIRQMTLDNTLGVVGGFLIVTAFLILGAELLQPRRLVPEEKKVAEVLATMMQQQWGLFGYWIMVSGVLVGFLATTLTNQDGWSRMLANGTWILLESTQLRKRLQNEKFLKKSILLVLATIAPIGLYAFVGEPVALLQAAGVIEAVHLPFIVALTLYLNTSLLPDKLKPSFASQLLTWLAMLFFIGFSALFIYQQITK